MRSHPSFNFTIQVRHALGVGSSFATPDRSLVAFALLSFALHNPRHAVLRSRKTWFHGTHGDHGRPFHLSRRRLHHRRQSRDPEGGGAAGGGEHGGDDLRGGGGDAAHG